jgi:hypothetical protein
VLCFRCFALSASVMSKARLDILVGVVCISLVYNFSSPILMNDRALALL